MEQAINSYNLIGLLPTNEIELIKILKKTFKNKLFEISTVYKHIKFSITFEILKKFFPWSFSVRILKFDIIFE